MKKQKFIKTLFLTCMLMMLCWGCKENEETQQGTSVNNINAVLTAPEGQVFTTSATIDVKVAGALDFAYKVVEGANATPVDGAVIYAEAQNKVDGIVKIEDDAQKINIYGLEGNKDYTVFFAFRADDGYKVESVSLKTPVYTQPLTIVDANMFKVTFHVEVPNDTYYKVSIVPTEVYRTNEELYGYKDFSYMADGDFMGEGQGMPLPQFKGPKTITFENGHSMYTGAYNEDKVLNWGEGTGSDPIEEADLITQINPGTSYQLIIWECQENGDISEFMFGGMSEINAQASSRATENPVSPVAPSEVYLSGELVTSVEMSMGGMDMGTYPKMFMRQGFFTQLPAPGNGEVKIEKVLVREKTLVMKMTPEEGVQTMKYNLIEEGENMEKLLKYVDGERGIESMIFSGGYESSKEIEVAFDVEVDKKYSLFVSAVYNDDATIRSLYKMTGIEIPKSTNPKAELTVEAVEPANGDPFVVMFKVKAPNKDCYAFRYLMNYTSEWFPMLNGIEGEEMDTKVAQMIGQYGTVVNEENGSDILKKINSDEGYILGFTSQDDKESWLALMSYNVDESTKLFYDGPQYRARSGKWEAETPVQSELFEKLEGEWTGTLKRPGESGMISTFDVTIGQEPAGYTTTLPEEIKADLIEYFKKQGNENPQAEVDKLWEEFKTSQEKYKDKYIGHNWMVGTGFCYDRISTRFATPLDLFGDTGYSAYDTDELFQDYGPKLFFKIGADNSITLVSSEMDDEGFYTTYIDPFEAWRNRISLYGYNEDYATDFSQYNFPCELSEDGNTLTIKPYEKNNFVFTPSFAQEMNMGAWSWNCKVDGNIVLTRKSDAESRASKSRASHLFVPGEYKVLPVKGNGMLRRTRLPKADVLPERVYHKPYTVANAQ